MTKRKIKIVEEIIYDEGHVDCFVWYNEDWVIYSSIMRGALEEEVEYIASLPAEYIIYPEYKP